MTMDRRIYPDGRMLIYVDSIFQNELTNANYSKFAH